METETITFAMNKAVVAQLRALRERSNRKKGFMGRTVSEALRQYLIDKTRTDKEEAAARQRLTQILKNDRLIGKLPVKTQCEECGYVRTFSLVSLIASANRDGKAY